MTMVGAINAAGNSIPPFLVFPRVHFKDAMLHGATPRQCWSCPSDRVDDNGELHGIYSSLHQVNQMFERASGVAYT